MMSHRDIVSLLTKTVELRAVRGSIDVPVGTIGQLGRKEVVAAELGPVGEQTRIHADLPKATAAIVDTYASGAKSTVTSNEYRLELTGATATIGNSITINGKRYEFSTGGTVAAGSVTVAIADGGAVTVANALVSVFGAKGVAGVVAATTDADVVVFRSQHPFTATAQMANVSTVVAAELIGGVAAFAITTPPQASCADGDKTVVTFDNYNLPNGLAALTGPSVTVEVV